MIKKNISAEEKASRTNGVAQAIIASDRMAFQLKTEQLKALRLARDAKQSAAVAADRLSTRPGRKSPAR